MIAVPMEFLIHYAGFWLIVGIGIGLVIGKLVDICRRMRRVENGRPVA